MGNSALRPDATLPEWLTAHARAVSGRRLVLDVVGGLLAAGAAALWRPAGWLALLGAGVCFAAFGAWGLADRRLAARTDAPWPPDDGDVGHSRLAWRALHAVAPVVGTAAAVLLVFALLFGVLGTWIS